ncbi:MAG: sugar phosphate isomerase/epimerase [Candidatus Hydrogenedentes bacterium]|nr:sugar phosphate isomerase/epimerase [Candidatus Hydrogenedentota bacterium]
MHRESHPKSALGRRNFLKTSALGGLGLAGLHAGSATAAPPVTRTGTPYMKLSLAAYSFNSLLPTRKPDAEQAAAKMRITDVVDFCAKMDLDGCELTSYYFPETVTQEYLLQLKRQTFRLGLDISGTAIGNDFGKVPGPERDEELRMTREWIDHAAFMGAPVIRIFAGHTPQGDTDANAIARCIEGIDESLGYAAQKGVALALENHGGITATPEMMLDIVKGVKDSPWFGVNFDGGNFQSDDPYRDLAKIAPYTLNAQLKVMVTKNGVREKADLDRIIGILKDAGYRGYVVLEYEDEEDPFVAIPRYLAELKKLIRG